MASMTTSKQTKKISFFNFLNINFYWQLLLLLATPLQHDGLPLTPKPEQGV